MIMFQHLIALRSTGAIIIFLNIVDDETTDPGIDDALKSPILF